jgi:hypothetical protein
MLEARIEGSALSALEVKPNFFTFAKMAFGRD